MKHNTAAPSQPAPTVAPAEIPPVASTTTSSDTKLPPIAMWSVNEVVQVLKAEGLPQKEVELFAEQAVVGQLLLDGLTDQDMSEMGVAQGLRRRAILAVIKRVVGAYA